MTTRDTTEPREYTDTIRRYDRLGVQLEANDPDAAAVYFHAGEAAERIDSLESENARLRERLAQVEADHLDERLVVNELRAERDRYREALLRLQRCVDPERAQEEALASTSPPQETEG